MSLNGISEAFVMSNVPSHSYNVFLMICSLIYWFCVVIFASSDSHYFINFNWGAYGLILASIVNMTMRILYNFYSIYQFDISQSKKRRIGKYKTQNGGCVYFLVSVFVFFLVCGYGSFFFMFFL